MRAAATKTAPAARWEYSTLWLAVQVFFTVLVLAHTFMSTLSVASCTDTSCDYAAFSAATNVSYIGAVALLPLSVLAMVLLQNHARAPHWAPITGIIFLLVLHTVTYAAGRAALTLPLFGNRLSDCC